MPPTEDSLREKQAQEKQIDPHGANGYTRTPAFNWKGTKGIPGKGIGQNTLKTPGKYLEIYDFQYFFPHAFVVMPFAPFQFKLWNGPNTVSESMVSKPNSVIFLPSRRSGERTQ